ncbi:MAG: Stp1/IreP family PP2C-type Ser/Thr phosphatase [Clostridiales bacterium]|jgi:serine/threonine protein phosphatase PrpC|nr:Stp1/IreP family PP2C-type Ser/Thr phosphatase [Clostridiales bacterium]
MKAYTISDIGKVRAENQDCVRFVQNTLPSFSVLALCDGMGGAKAGGLASEIAMNAFISRITDSITEKKSKAALKNILTDAVEYANQCVFERGSLDSSCAGMGTTLVAAFLKGRQCLVVNVGDSRAYLISGGAISQISVDHSFVEDMVKRGSITREQARNHPRRNVITRALGAESTVECDFFTPEFKKNDLLLLCSDGLSNTVSDSEILEIAEKHKSLDDIGRELLDLALLRGAPDNVTLGILRK